MDIESPCAGDAKTEALEDAGNQDFNDGRGCDPVLPFDDERNMQPRIITRPLGKIFKAMVACKDDHGVI